MYSEKIYENAVMAHPEIFDKERYVHGLKVAEKYNYVPNDSMIIIGVTGTKGKTTTTYMIKNILEKAGKKVAICGTLGAYINGEHIEERNTTPSADEVYKLLDMAKRCGCQYFVMEVSSQGIKQCRVAGIKFDYGVFTNISKDHIGGPEHKDMEEYILCKSLLIQGCDKAVINNDEIVKDKIIAGRTKEVYYYGIENTDNCTLAAKILNQESLSIVFAISDNGNFERESKNYEKYDDNFFEEKEVFKNISYSGKIDFPLLGRFNVSNSLAAMMVTYLEGIDFKYVKEALEEFSVRGREEAVKLYNGATLIIDYAHNAASMESILTDIKTYKFDRVICVFGCGGNRSEERRISMGEVSGRHADLSVITEDNSRLENVHRIIKDIEKGVLKSKGKYVIIADRKTAIEYSMAIARKNDVILLLGKGHETYQDSGGVKRPFDERSIVADFDKLCKENENGSAVFRRNCKQFL